MSVPGRHRLVPRGELRVGGDPALLLGAQEDALATGVPAVVELAFVFIRPFLRDVMRAVNGAARPKHAKRLVGLESLVPVQPGDCVLGQVLAQVVSLFRSFRRTDVGCVADQVRLVLRGLAGEEAIEIFKAEAGGPVLELTGRRGLLSRRVVPLAPGGRGVAVILQDLRGQRAAPWNEARIAVPIIGQLGDLTVSDAVMNAPGQQRRPGRRAHRRGVEAVVRDPLLDDAIHRRGVHFTAERRRQGGSGVVDEHDENVRRVGRKPARLW